ncbi:L,D-transpeptidase family protein [Williamsia sterculiae]
MRFFVLLGMAVSFVAFPAMANADPASTQLIVVSAAKQSDQTATLTAYQRQGTTWRPIIGPALAHLGTLGMGVPADNVSRTPMGTFRLDQAFGRQANPGTAMPYFRSTQQDWWDENPSSPTYNTHVRSSTSPGGDSENLYDSGPVYDYAVNIAHNPTRTPGRASGMFLHVTDGQPTQGCVATDRNTMIALLRWLDPKQTPTISIGVNVPAPTSGSAPVVPAGDLPGRDLLPSWLLDLIATVQRMLPV